MLWSYAKTAWYNLWAQKLHSAIIVAGLAAGIGCCLLIIAFVRQELAWDRHHAAAERLYRVALDVRPPDGAAPISLASNAPQVAPLLQADFAQVEATARLLDWQTWLAPQGGEALPRSVALVDPAFTSLFDFRWEEGQPAGALVDPAAIVLRRDTAQRLFGPGPALGRSVMLEGGRLARVTGVIADQGPPSHLAFDALLPMDLASALYGPNALQNWSMQLFHTYVLLQPGASSAALAAQFPAFIERHIGTDTSKLFSYELMPVTDLHLHSARRNELTAPGNLNTVRAFTGLAVVVLLVASINFMNLASVAAVRRLREVSIRKTLGAGRRTVLAQFLGEAALLSTLAVLVGAMCAELALPYFNAAMQLQLRLDPVTSLWLLPLLVCSVTLVAGLYPALQLASFKATSAGRSGGAGPVGVQAARRVLVVLQFAAAVALLVSAWVIQAQLQHARQVEPGYRSDGIVVLDSLGPQGVGRDWDLLRQELQSHPGVLAVTASNQLPSTAVGSSYYIRHEGAADNRSMPVMLVDFDYVDTYGIEVLAGRAHAREFATDLPAAGRGGGSFLINALAARQLGWTPEQAVGKQFGIACCGMEAGQVIGVVADVQHGSVHTPRGPIVYAIPPEPLERVHAETRAGLQRVSLRVDTRQLQETLRFIDSTWQRLRPQQPVSRYFLDETLAGLYRAEERQGRLVAAFTLLALVITCMGLYALSAHDAQRRTKEIGVRKVMGGSVWQIVLLLTNDFSRLVLIANVIAWPLAWVAMSRWLEQFAYRIDLTPLVFIGSGLIALCVAWVTVGSTAAKAAGAKPVLALKYE